jgi:hypothetical protein
MIDATAPAGTWTIFSTLIQVKATERPRGKLRKSPSGKAGRLGIWIIQ